MKIVHKAVLALIGAGWAGMVSGANMERHFELANGHFVVVLDDTVATVALEERQIPGKCRTGLALREEGEGWTVRKTAGGCFDDANGTLRLNPAWSERLSLHMSAGQIEIGRGLLERASVLRATVKVGDVTGVSGVKRSWVVGARADRDAPGGASLRAAVGAGQISFQ